ncbi:TonB-dependent receptor [Arsenophonus endosymbiont of Aleurodicus floccissimus]|uniref:TonB-dependent receptor n=1 Tax=Arsenophonus endosymbiont of Aleurodicus floccissimus TaxID=2152761 RepID=UPI000E6B1B07|nr:TonB-dependent receptor [Arsenophonus endosymbiont of Aleurodicus floccissimus]
MPRIPAYRVSATIEHQWFESLTGRLRFTHVGSQHKAAQYETPTAGYNRVDVGLTWQNHLNDLDYMLYGRIENLFNGVARDHTSYIKNEMYLPGRNFVIEASLSF